LAETEIKRPRRRQVPTDLVVSREAAGMSGISEFCERHMQAYGGVPPPEALPQGPGFGGD